KIVPDPQLPIDEQDPFPIDANISNYLRDVMRSIAKQAGLPSNQPFAELPTKVQDAFFYGSKERLTLPYGAYEYKTDWKGAVAYLTARAEEMKSESGIAAFEALISPSVCQACGGRRLQPASLAVRVAGRIIADYTALPITEAVRVARAIKLS